MEDQHMTQQVFADFLQQSPATLSSIFNGRTRPTLNIIDSIKTKIPDINIEWLLYGTGDMYLTHPEGSSEGASEGQNQALEPMINFDSSAPSSSPFPQMAQNGVSATPYQQGFRTARPEAVREEIKIVDKPLRKVTEIRVYYDDQTYETFVPEKK